MPLVIKSRKIDPVLRGVASKFTKYEKQIYDIYMKAFAQMPNDLNNPITLEMIRAAIESSNPSGGALGLQWRNFIGALDKSIPTLANQLAASANINAAALPKSIQISSSFTATDPRAIAWAQQRAGARILGITKESQKAVAESIARGLKGRLNREEVIDGVSRVVGLDSRQARALDTFYEKNLNDLLDDGLSYEKAARAAKKLSENYRDRLIRQRATRIARTETNAAANAGRLLSWTEADIQGLLPTGSEKRWKTSQDERNCPTCAPMHNETVPWQGTFSTGDVMPPVHPNCLCTAVIVPAEAEYEKSVEKRYYRYADGEKTWRNYDYKWRKIANEMKEKVGKCQRCGSTSDLTVDHKKRLKDGGAKYDRKNLRVLCRACNGRASRLGTKLRKQENLYELFIKHGTHNQKTHGRKGGGRGGSVGYDSERDKELSTRQDEISARKMAIYEEHGINPFSVNPSNYKETLPPEAQEEWIKLDEEWDSINQERSDIRKEFLDDAITMKSGRSPDDENFGFSDESLLAVRDDWVVDNNGATLRTNASLRRTGRVTSKVERFDSMIAEGEIKNPTAVYRAAILQPDQIETLQVGTSFVDRGFQAVGHEASDAISYGDGRATEIVGDKVLFEYVLQPGLNAVDVGYGEIVVQRGAKVTIVGVSKRGDYTVIQADVSKS